MLMSLALAKRNVQFYKLIQQTNKIKQSKKSKLL